MSLEGFSCSLNKADLWALSIADEPLSASILIYVDRQSCRVIWLLNSAQAHTGLLVEGCCTGFSHRDSDTFWYLSVAIVMEMYREWVWRLHQEQIWSMLNLRKLSMSHICESHNENKEIEEGLIPAGSRVWDTCFCIFMLSEQCSQVMGVPLMVMAAHFRTDLTG